MDPSSKYKLDDEAVNRIAAEYAPVGFLQELAENLGIVGLGNPEYTHDENVHAIDVQVMRLPTPEQEFNQAELSPIEIGSYHIALDKLGTVKALSYVKRNDEQMEPDLARGAGVLDGFTPFSLPSVYFNDEGEMVRLDNDTNVNFPGIIDESGGLKYAEVDPGIKAESGGEAAFGFNAVPSYLCNLKFDPERNKDTLADYFTERGGVPFSDEKMLEMIEKSVPHFALGEGSYEKGLKVLKEGNSGDKYNSPDLPPGLLLDAMKKNLTEIKKGNKGYDAGSEHKN